MKHFPDIIQLGDVASIPLLRIRDIDLLIGGSPCQDLSRAKHGKGLKGSKSSLFYHFAMAKDVLEPRYFLLENVASMKNSERDNISEILGVEPILINSKHFTSQNRERYYWTNINVELPTWSGPTISEVIKQSATALTEKRSEKAKAERRRVRAATGKDFSSFRDKITVKRVDQLANCVTTTKSPNMRIETKEGIRFLTPLECERLQGMKNNYTVGVSNAQRYKMIGNGFTIPVIEHILKGMRTNG